MRYLEYGNTGKDVSVIGLGCMRMANLDSRQADAVVRAALDSGINFFDHADIYGGGRSEEIFAGVLKKEPSLRDRLFIQSKCAIRDGMYDVSKDHILRSVDGILSRLGTDRLDCLLLHRPDALMEMDEVNSAFTELHKAGKVLSFGVSNMNRFQMELLQSGLDYQICADQLQMSLAHTPMIDEGINVNTYFDGAVTRASGTLEYCRLNRPGLQSRKASSTARSSVTRIMPSSTWFWIHWQNRTTQRPMPWLMHGFCAIRQGCR